LQQIRRTPFFFGPRSTLTSSPEADSTCSAQCFLSHYSSPPFRWCSLRSDQCPSLPSPFSAHGNDVSLTSRQDNHPPKINFLTSLEEDFFLFCKLHSARFFPPPGVRTSSLNQWLISVARLPGKDGFLGGEPLTGLLSSFFSLWLSFC